MLRSNAFLLLALLAGPLFAGCGQAPPGDADEDLPRQFPRDIDAPPPEPVENPPEFIDPPDPDTPYTLFGRVTDLAGRPIANATVFVEGSELREPENNIPVYLEGRNATLVRTNATGRYQFNLEGGFYHVLAEARGYLPARTEPVPSDETPTRADIRLVAEPVVRIIAHRGSAYYAPENTLAAVHKGILLGAHHVEIDVQLTADDQVIVLHDDGLDRTTDGSGPVREATLEEIRRLDAGAWFHPSFRGEGVPTLAETLAFAKAHDARVIVDVKSVPERSERTTQRTLETIRDSGHQSAAIFASFDAQAVRTCVIFAGPECAFISRGPGTGSEVVAQTKQLGAPTLLMRYDLATWKAVSDAHAAGIRVFVWTLNDPEQWDPVIDRGVDGVITDRPGYLLDLLNERYQAQASTP